MPPKKATEAVTSKIEGAPDEAVMLFAFECLKAFGEDRLLDMNALSKALGHTNTKSTRNAFFRHKNKWGFGNIPCKTGAGKSDDILPVDGSSALKPDNEVNKVTKKRGRPSTKTASPAKKVDAKVSPAQIKDEEDTESRGVKSEASDTD